MINKDKIIDHYNELHDQYKRLDQLIKGNIQLLSLLDGEHNLYAYSDKVRLFEALDMIIKGHSGYSDIDLINRVIHFIAMQYNIFHSLQQNGELSGEEGIMMAEIQSNLIRTIQTLLMSVSTENLPEYISKWLTKYVSLSNTKEGLKRKKILDDRGE